MTKQIRGMVLLVLLIASIATANVVYVDCNGPNDPGTGTFEDPFHRIQAGIDAAIEGDTIWINPGVYTGASNYDLDPHGKSITIRSANPEDAKVIANTVIDPNRAGRGFYIHTGEDTNCVISGLTIKNAYTTDVGAGIYCYKSNPTITNCIFMYNDADLYGGGAICCEESNSIFVNCTISNNSAYDGGGLECWSSGNPLLINCIISNNHAVRYGGGVDGYNHSNPQLVNCTLVNNTVDINGVGGAICLWSSNINIKNSILWANEATAGAQLYLHFTSSASVSYCDVQGGISDVYAPESDVNWGSGNTDSDPCFVLFDPNGDPNLCDFHLRSDYGRWDSTFYKIDLNNNGTINLIEFAMIASVWVQQGNNTPEDLDNSGLIDWTDMELFAQYYLTNSIENEWVTDSSTSPCVDAGDPNSDWTGEPWPNGNRINMGAYGGTEQASKSGNIADFDIDGKVDFIDFAQFTEQWNQDTNTIEDMNRDGVVDVLDLDIFTDNWLCSRL